MKPETWELLQELATNLRRTGVTDDPTVECVDEILSLRAQLASARSAGVRGVVVIPEPTADALDCLCLEICNEDIEAEEIVKSIFAWARQHARIEPAPLQDGEVVVRREELEALRSLYSWMSTGNDHFKISFSMTEFPQGIVCLEAISSAIDAIDALRAAQPAKREGARDA